MSRFLVVSLGLWVASALAVILFHHNIIAENVFITLSVNLLWQLLHALWKDAR